MSRLSDENKIRLFKLFCLYLLWIFIGYFLGSRSFSLGYYIWLVLGLLITISYLLTKTSKLVYSKKVYSIILGIIGISVLGLTFYVNYYMPHGPMYDTGEIVCENDDRGPCGEQFKEDVGKLNIPDWAKILRENGFWLGVIILFLASYVYASDKYYKED